MTVEIVVVEAPAERFDEEGSCYGCGGSIRIVSDEKREMVTMILAR